MLSGNRTVRKLALKRFYFVRVSALVPSGQRVDQPAERDEAPTTIKVTGQGQGDLAKGIPGGPRVLFIKINKKN